MSTTIENLMTIFKLAEYNKYHKCIRNFRSGNKLPRPQNRGRILSNKEIQTNLNLSEVAKNACIINVSHHRVSSELTDADLDAFYNEINDFSKRVWLFKEYYKSYTNNLNRLNPQCISRNLDLIVLQQILENDRDYPTNFLPVLVYHLKRKFKLTTAVYEWFCLSFSLWCLND